MRTVELLEYLAARHDDPARLREISDALDMPRSSAHALLRTLVAQGWVRIGRDGHLVRDRRAGAAGRHELSRQRPVPAADHAVPRRPARRTSTRPSTSAASTAPTSCTSRRGSPSSTTASSNRVGRRLPAYATALGKSLLAERFGTERDAHVPAALKPLTDKTIVDRAALDDDLDEVRVRGYATDDEENTTGLRCFAVALRYCQPAAGRHQRVGTRRPVDPAARTRDRRRAAHHGRQGVSRGRPLGQRRQMVRDPSIRRLR